MAKSQRLEALTTELSTWDALERETGDLSSLVAEAIETRESEMHAELDVSYRALEKRYTELEFFVLLSDQYDERDAILSIHAGTGGTDAQDWAAMLLRMFLRWAERHGWAAQVVDETRGQEAGIKSATITVTGRFAYGYLKSEAGVHRLVRVSPFDAEAMRHTSFALVEVIPELGKVADVPINEKDVRVDTFLSSGHGGQSVQTTYSAVRIVHLPTGITVSCQNERSQRQNRETAMKILLAKLYQLELAKQERLEEKLRGGYTQAEWGNQIRSYVLHPYKQVKDHRTKHETTRTADVLDGDLDQFAEAYLRWRRQQTR